MATTTTTDEYGRPPTKKGDPKAVYPFNVDKKQKPPKPKPLPK